MIPRRPLSEYVTPPEPSSAELNVEWHEVRRRVRRHRQVRVAGVVVAALLVVGAGLGLTGRTQEPLLLMGQGALALEVPRIFKLSDGSRLELSPGAQLSLPLADEREVVLVLERGLASFDVSKKPTRRFVVKADAIEVRVIGTKFTVRREGRDVEVEVERGIVEVREGDVVTRLVKGQRWARALEVAKNSVEENDPQPSFDPPTRRKPVRRNKHPEPEPEPVAEVPAPADPQAPAAEEVAPPEPSPADTFAAAMQARAAGRAKEAIAGFQQVCERWPSSAFAPMSAFEWGRLALDSQDDPRQAARAFERTLELATAASLVEDALARLTEAYARYDAVSCRRVQSEYLRRFPGGPHVRGVTKACPP